MRSRTQGLATEGTTAVTGAPTPIVAALAGRRIDAAGAEPARFPLARAPAVQRAIAEVLARESVGLLVCSAACGADLLALQAAIDLDVRCRVILPFDPADFRRTSVTDRPGPWGSLYDGIIAAVARAGDLVVLDGSVGDDQAYRGANEMIVREAVLAAGSSHGLAILVWDGRPHEDVTDATAEFRRLTAGAGMYERVVVTCGD